MKKTVFYIRFFLLALCVALFAAIAPFHARGEEAAPQKDTEWRELFADDKGYHDEYNKIQAKEETFSGVLTYEEEKNPSTLMRWTPFKLDGVGVYVGSQDLKEYVGKKVEIVGKKNSFALEGQVVTEIWPVKIRVVAAQEEQPKAVEQKEIPAKAVNGLLFEIKLLNTRPLLPGDKTLEFEHRFTNVGDKELQLREYPLQCFAEKLIGPDGSETEIDHPLYEMLPPERPAAILLPGDFYGGKHKVILAAGMKPGKYAFTLHYGTNWDLKDKGFNCWTGAIESNTIVFEVMGADVKPVNGIQMFIRMTKDVYTGDEPVMFEARLFNAGDKEQEVYVPDEYLLNDSQGTVTDEDGKVVEWRIGRDERLHDTKYAKLAPGAVFVKEYDLRSVCTLPSGKYTFRLTSNIPWSKMREIPGPSVSNEVHFEVVKSEDGVNP